MLQHAFEPATFVHLFSRPTGRLTLVGWCTLPLFWLETTSRMKRRTFIKSLAGAAIVGRSRRAACFRRLPKMKITRVRAYLPPNPNPLFNQSDVVVTIETDAGITGIGEGGSKDMLSQSAGQIDRPRSAAHRTALAGHEPGILLSGGPREDPRHRRARSCVVGHQGQSPGPAGARIARRHGAQLLRVLQHGRHSSRHHARA